MTTLTVTAKGRITLCKDLLRHLGVAPGQMITVDKLPDGVLTLRAEQNIGKISDLVGILKRPGQPTLSIEEINEAIADAWAGSETPLKS